MCVSKGSSEGKERGHETNQPFTQLLGWWDKRGVREVTQARGTPTAVTCRSWDCSAQVLWHPRVVDLDRVDYSLRVPSSSSRFDYNHVGHLSSLSVRGHLGV